MPIDSVPVLLAGVAPPEGGYDADVVILSHHRPRETIAAIGSAAGQTGCRHHVIVLDQGSSSAHRAALVAAVAPLGNVALYGVAENHGVPGGRNRATALGHGQAIIALDNDARFAAHDVVARAAARLAILPDLGAIGFRIMAGDGAALDATSWGYPKSLRAAAGARFTTTTFVGCGHALSRACFDTLGGYDETLFFTWEEYELSRRAIAAGWHIEHHGDLAVIHSVAAEARVAWQGERWRYYVRNRLLIAHDWHGLAGMVPRACVFLARGAVAGRPRATIAAMLEAVRTASGRPRRHDGAAGRRYVLTNETAHRLPQRVWGSVSAAPVPTASAMPAPRGASPEPIGR